jgi:hypothetical protein
LTQRTSKYSLCFFALVAAACSSEKQVAVTCDINTAAINTCTEGKVPESQSSSYQLTCTSQGGSVGFDPCARPNYLGVCNDVSSGGVDATVYAYQSSTIQTVADAMTACTQNLGGSFTANAAFATANKYECTNAQYCAAFPALTSAQVATASSYCQMFGLPAVTSGACDAGTASGYCTVQTTTVGQVFVWFYDGIVTKDQATCQQTLQGTWTTL